MIIPADFERCTICCKPRQLTSEHIIPESIGGTLEAYIQCKECNDTLGSKLVSQAKQDPLLRSAIINLQKKLPKLYLSMEKGQKYTALDILGNEISVKLKEGKFETIAKKKEDGSLILDTRKGQKNIRYMLEKNKLTLGEIDSSIQRFKDAPENSLIHFSKSVSAVKWKVESFFPLLDKPNMSSRLVMLIAYNYLCLAYGKYIFNNWFDFLRNFIAKDVPNDKICIERFYSSNYKCYHKLFAESDEEETRVHIIFFDWLKYVVHIKGFVSNLSHYVYIEDLKNKRGLISESLEHAKRGEYYLTKITPVDKNSHTS